jgi:hypothetical protein
MAGLDYLLYFHQSPTSIFALALLTALSLVFGVETASLDMLGELAL